MRRYSLGVMVWFALLGCGGPQVDPLERTIPLSAKEPAEAWDSARSDERLEKEFVRFDLERRADAEGSPTLRWTFVPRTTGFADLFLRRPIEVSFRAIELEVYNLGPAVELAVKLADAGGAEWTVEPVTLDGPGWQRFRWRRDQFRVAPWSDDRDGVLDLPTRYLAIIVFDLRKEATYELWVRGPSVIRHVVHVPGVNIAVPKTIRADQPLPVTMRFAGPPKEAPWWIDLRREGRTVVRRKLGRVLSGTEVAVSLPLYLPGGTYDVVPSLGDMAVVDGPDAPPVSTRVEISPRPARSDDTIAQVQPHGGVPTLFLNGQPNACMAYMTYRPNPRYFGQFGRAGVRVFSFSSTPTASAYGLSPTTWVAPDEFDYSNLDKRARMLLDPVPEAYFFPRIYLFSPTWWDERHPDDLVTYDPGDDGPRPFLHGQSKRVPCWASQAWREDTARAIRRYIAYVESTPYADRVIGYHLASGTTEEWMMWGANENQWVDYCPANVAAFRRWLTRRYKTDEALRRAWNDTSVTLDTAEVPPKPARARTLFGILRDPAREQPAIDYTFYTSDLVAETIGTFARVVKQATRGNKLVGVFYGYVLQLMDQRMQNAGHLALQKVWTNPDIDFITSPSSYYSRRPGSGYGHFMSLTDSVKLHGKLWINENDYRTWLTGVPRGKWGKTDTYEATLKQERRELASVLGQGCGQWWFDMGGGWFDDSRMMTRIARHRTIADRTLRLPRGNVAEIAVIVDDKSLNYLRPGNPLNKPLLLDILPRLARVGAPLSYYALSDLPEVPEHKMYVFLNPIAPDAEDRQAIDALKANGHVLVFLWAAGVFRDGKLDPKGMTDLVGIRIAMREDRAPVHGTFVGSDKLAGGLRQPTTQTKLSIAPSFLVDDSEAIPLAKDEDGRTLVAVRRRPSWTSVYAAGPLHSRGFFRRLAEAAGVHCYIDTPDVVYATESLLGIACDESGKRSVRLREPARVWELFSDRLVCNGADEFSIHMEEHDTALLRLENRR